ncbi:PAS domain-containing protein [Amaricoccus solimangrovi]|nr:PAS domain-containing protein [Amaricoccus solimangrovi]
MLTSLHSYWDRLRAGRAAPYRAEIDPREFEAALENMFILERLSPGNLRVRLAGMKLCEMMGMEVRGMEAGFLIGESDRERFERLLDVAMSEPAVIELRLEARMRSGGFRASMLLMPLRGDLGEINRVLGCLGGEGEHYAPPLSFTIQDVSVSPVETRDQPAAEAPRRALPGFAEEQPAFAGQPPRLRAIEGNPHARGPGEGLRPYLRVIDPD